MITPALQYHCAMSWSNVTAFLGELDDQLTYMFGVSPASMQRLSQAPFSRSEEKASVVLSWDNEHLLIRVGSLSIGFKGFIGDEQLDAWITRYTGKSLYA